MPRYIDADQVLKFIRETNENCHWLLSHYSAGWIYDFIESQPVADVIPKSEVDRLKAEAQNLRNANADLSLALLYECTPTREHLSELEKAVRYKVASEIFEELEYHSVAGEISIYSEYFSELKKKYTEDRHDSD